MVDCYLLSKCFHKKLFIFLIYKQITILVNCETVNYGVFSSDNYSYVLDPVYMLPDITIAITFSRTNSFFESCADLVKHYSHVAANFTKCVVSNARSTAMCQLCIQNYLDTHEVQSKISNNSDCDNLTKNVRNHVIGKTIEFVNALWDTSNCYNCFDVTRDENKTTHYILNSQTLEFLQRMNVTLDCLNITRNETNMESFPVHNISNNTCKVCEDDYKNLTSLYADIVFSTSNHACLDIVDKMDFLRNIWSDCVIINKDYFTIILISTTFFLVPLVFYIAVRIQSNIQAKKLAKQKRLKYFSISSRSRSSISS